MKTKTAHSSLYILGLLVTGSDMLTNRFVVGGSDMVDVVILDDDTMEG